MSSARRFIHNHFQWARRFIRRTSSIFSTSDGSSIFTLDTSVFSASPKSLVSPPIQTYPFPSIEPKIRRPKPLLDDFDDPDKADAAAYKLFLERLPNIRRTTKYYNKRHRLRNVATQTETKRKKTRLRESNTRRIHEKGQVARCTNR